MIGFLCKKLFMSYIYNDYGAFVPVTIANIFNCYVHNFSFFNNYFYVTVCYFFNKFFNNNKLFLKNFIVNDFDFYSLISTNKIPLNLFYVNQSVNISGVSLGKGFSGVIKKHNFNSNYSTHGNSKSENKPGSIGMCQDPGRVYPGKKMPGRLGNKKVFFKNTNILKIDFKHNIFYFKGGLPGFRNSIFLVYPF